MLKMHLVLRHGTDTMLELVLPASFRIAFGAIAGILTASMISLGSVSILGIIIIVITALASIYEERWRFDGASRKVTHISGLLIAHRNTVFDFDDIEEFVLSNFREIPDGNLISANRAVAVRSLVSFHMLLKNGGSRTIEIRANRYGTSLKQNAEAVSGFCSLPLTFRA